MFVDIDIVKSCNICISIFSIFYSLFNKNTIKFSFVSWYNLDRIIL